MRLKDHMNLAAGAGACRLQRGANFGGVVSVIIDNGHAARLAALLEAPIDAAKVLEPFGNLRGRNFKLPRDGHGGRGVEHIVPAGNMDLKWTERSRRGVHLEERERAWLPRRLRRIQNGIEDFKSEIRLRGQAVSKYAPPHARQNAFEQRIVDAGRHGAVKRDAVHEIQERALHVGHVVIAIHVLAIEIGHHGQDRRELEERAVALVGLGHEILRGAKSRVRAKRVHPPAHHHRGIEPACTQHRGHHRRGGGFAVHAGNGDAVFEPHQLGQHLRTLNHGNLARLRLQHFWVFRVHCRAGDDHRRPGHVGRVVPFVNRRAQLRQPVSDGAALQIRAGNLHAQVEQDFGNAAHADAADTDEVRVL